MVQTSILTWEKTKNKIDHLEAENRYLVPCASHLKPEEQRILSDLTDWLLLGISGAFSVIAGKSSCRWQRRSPFTRRLELRLSALGDGDGEYVGRGIRDGDNGDARGVVGADQMPFSPSVVGVLSLPEWAIIPLRAFLHPGIEGKTCDPPYVFEMVSNLLLINSHAWRSVFRAITADSSLAAQWPCKILHYQCAAKNLSQFIQII